MNKFTLVSLSIALMSATFPFAVWGQSSDTCGDQLKRMEVQRDATYDQISDDRRRGLSGTEARRRIKSLTKLYSRYTRTRDAGMGSSERTKDECGPLETQFMEKLDLVESGQLKYHNKSDLLPFEPDLTEIRGQRVDDMPNAERESPQDAEQDSPQDPSSRPSDVQDATEAPENGA